jgi:hypothetical protein
MQLSFTSSANAAGAASWTVSEVAVGEPGTRLETSGSESDADSFFYLYFQNGTTLVQMYMQRDSVTGGVSAGGTATMPTVGTITLPTIAFAGVGGLVVSPVLGFFSFVGVIYLLL